jgi:imidazolonepropionase-like amidohydrolase
MRRRFFLFLIILKIPSFWSQLEPENGLKESQVDKIAITHVDVLVRPGVKVKDATVLISGKRILAINESNSVPEGFVTYDREGYTVVPAFVETYSDAGTTPAKSEYQGYYPQLESAKKGDYYWNESIHPEVRAVEKINTKDTKFNELLQLGFGFVSPICQDGIVQGTAPLLCLGSENEREGILKTDNALYFSFQKGVSQQTYPSSLMGSIALLRQAFYDLEYFKKVPSAPLGKQSMQPWIAFESLPSFFKLNDKWDILRAERIAKEFNKSFVYGTSGNEYAIADQLKNENARLVVPLNFPKPFDLNDPNAVRNVSIEELKHWEMAPYNFMVLKEKGLQVALTSQGIPANEFWKAIRKMIALGANPNDILEALTLTPAAFLQADSLLGTLEPGKLASFGLYNHDPFQYEAELHEMWCLGTKKTFKNLSANALGKYTLKLNNARYELEVKGLPEKPTATVVELKDIWDKKLKIFRKDSLRTNVSISVVEQNVVFQVTFEKDKALEPHIFRGKIIGSGSVWEGDLMYPDGSWGQWSAIRKMKIKDTTSKITTSTLNIPTGWFPNMAYGNPQIPKEESSVFEKVTIWTNDSIGIIREGFVVTSGGKIIYVGKAKPTYPVGAKVIDGTNMHLTSGIIDEHSHIAITRGVNEGGQSVSAEVSIGDVVYPEDISIYRQLAGGVTAAQLLHGSANAIGGQSALIKLKWGETPEKMKIQNAPGFIKFALGENVKQSNWGDRNVVRFPQTRMGVEQVYYDAFYRAKEYKNASQDAEKSAKVFRRDIELDVLSEILDGKRFITCHSYVQSEINMLMKVADSMKFKVNTFTHILEGYKVADKMAKHGAGGSTFADWWAYKFEVNEAIPYNAALMHQQGVVVAINSDDAEMGRRLNQEAAKAVKYGGVTEEEAWKMVTLNPAKLLHLDQRMGSVSVGKDADLVLWTDNPLSILAQVKLTMIEGAIFYSMDNNSIAQQRNADEKMRLLRNMLNKSSSTESKRSIFPIKKKFYHCNTLGEEGTTNENLH